MRHIHVILGENIPTLLEDIISKYSINKIIALGKVETEIPLIQVHQLDFNINEVKSDFSGITSLSRTISENYKDSSLYICLNSSLTIHSLVMMFLAISLEAPSYIIDNNNILNIPPIPLRRAKSEEIDFLSALIAFNGEVDSFGAISAHIGWGKNEDDAKGVAKASYVSKILEKENLIIKNKEKRKVKVSLTDKGKFYSNLLQLNK